MPVGQTHRPSVHVSFSPHSRPHPPQWLVSNLVSMHISLQNIRSPGQRSTHERLLQNCFSVQKTLQPPQFCWLVDVSMHWPEQQVSPVCEQLLLQSPQCLSSDCRLAQSLPHVVWSLLHFGFFLLFFPLVFPLPFPLPAIAVSWVTSALSPVAMARPRDCRVPRRLSDDPMIRVRLSKFLLSTAISSFTLTPTSHGGGPSETVEVCATAHRNTSVKILNFEACS